MRYLSRLLLVCLLLVPAQAAVQREQRIALPDGRLIQVKQPANEPFSMGSLSVRLYAPMSPNYPYDNFVNGLVIHRDGSLERLDLYDLDGDGKQELIIICRSVGTGNYKAAYAFTVQGTILTPFSTITGIPPEEQVLERLQRN